MNRLLSIVVNQSATALKDRQRIEWLREHLKKTGIQGQGLVLEFPFPEIAADLGRAREYIDALRSLGPGLSLRNTRELDTLLNDVNLLPADYIRITETQIRRQPGVWEDVIKAAHDGGKRVVVSQIENPELLGQLWSKGVDYIQGYFIQRPGKGLNYDFSGAVLG